MHRSTTHVATTDSQLLHEDCTHQCRRPVCCLLEAMNQAVRRNLDRFPEDFMFQLTWEEARNLRSQIVTLNGQKT
ncbi:MAG: ORF6N domain-containing protein [Planctomycetes bacterium]|nr:ORF6N domain-containing protein [Planctomycetota bacterium]